MAGLNEEKSCPLKTSIHDVLSPELERLQDMLNRGYDIDEIEPIKNRTLLIRCSIQGKKEMVRFLIQHGAKLDIQDIAGDTALMWASYKGYQDIKTLLIQHGAQWLIKNKRGETFLQWSPELNRCNGVIYHKKKDCVICLESNFGFIECGQCEKKICEICFRKIEKCPYCRTKYTKTYIL